jgi:hypothetical protein
MTSAEGRHSKYSRHCVLVERCAYADRAGGVSRLSKVHFCIFPANKLILKR